MESLDTIEAAHATVAQVRPFTAADIPQVMRLHYLTFGDGRPPDPQRYHDYFSRVFLTSCVTGAPSPSVVHEEADGRITGFAGLVPRRVLAHGREFHAIVASQVAVDRESLAGLVAARLAKAVLEGPQDLAIADEASDVARKIWTCLGGTVVPLMSLFWTRPLRTGAFSLALGGQRRERITDPKLISEPLTAAFMAAHDSDFQPPELLRVAHDTATWQWLLDRAARTGGELLCEAVNDRHGLLGWYVAHVGSDRIADVLQMTASAESIGLVLDQLFFRARRRGATAVSGRLEGRFLQALSDKSCVFHRRDTWMLVKANASDLIRAFLTGEAGFSRLDGEWTLRFMS